MLNVAIKAARTAGTIINRAALDVESVRVSAKQTNDFVTEVDHAAETAAGVAGTVGRIEAEERGLRVGVVGGGGTGSAVAMLLARERPCGRVDRPRRGCGI